VPVPVPLAWPLEVVADWRLFVIEGPYCYGWKVLRARLPYHGTRLTRECRSRGAILGSTNSTWFFKGHSNCRVVK